MAQSPNGYFQPDDLGHYFNEIKDHELLTKEQEKALARRYREYDDHKAAHRLVRANLRLVVKIARDCQGNMGQFALSDLIQQGNLGLLRAVDKFDPDRQTKFSYYAAFWIKAFIFKYLIDNFSSVRIGKTQAQRKLFFNLRKTKEKLRRKGLPVTAEKIAGTVGVKADEVKEMEQRMAFKDKSLNAPWGTRSEEQLVDHLRAKGQSAEEMLAGRQMIRLVRRIIAEFKLCLTQREQEILKRRIVAREPLTLQKLGDRFGVSKERIRQIEKRIIRNLRSYFRARFPDFQTWLAD